MAEYMGMTIPADERRSSDRIDVSDAGIGHRFGHFRHSMVQGLAFVLALTVFFYAASVIDPGQSSAYSGDQTPTDGQMINPTLSVSSGSLGALTSLEFTVEIHASADGPRYTVRDSDGVILGAMLEAPEVEQVAPGLELEGMLADPIMLAEPRSSYPD